LSVYIKSVFVKLIMRGRIIVHPKISSLIGDMCFIERYMGSGEKFVLAVILVGPYDLTFRNVSVECQNMYRNVSNVTFCIY